jgi:hypothetical protein
LKAFRLAIFFNEFSGQVLRNCLIMIEFRDVNITDTYSLGSGTSSVASPKEG